MYGTELKELTEKFLSAVPTSQKNTGTAVYMTDAELEKEVQELRSTYSDMPEYCVYPDCFHCPYGDCGWSKAGNEELIQGMVRAFSRRLMMEDRGRTK